MAILAAKQLPILRSTLLSGLLSLSFLSPAYAQAPDLSNNIERSWQISVNGSDPLQGVDLEALEAQKSLLMAQKKNPESATLLSVIPGAGHFYAGNNTRGSWVLGGFAGTLLLSFLGSYLLSSIDSDVARTAAVIVNVAPTSAYWAWNLSDTYYQTVLQNQNIDQQLQGISLKQKEYGYYSSLLHLYF